MSTNDRPVAYKAGVCYIEPDAWLKGDLDNMERIIRSRGIDLYGTLDYKEINDTTGVYSLGKADILTVISEFFGQRDKTQFILYFSGHGDSDGSWVIPVTVPLTSPQCSVASPLDFAARTRSQPRPESPSTAPSQEADIIPVLCSDSSINESNEARVVSAAPIPVARFNDLVKYSDVVKLWDESNGKGRERRRLMIILDSCHSGRWVQAVDGEVDFDNEAEDYGTFQTIQVPPPRSDICIQASCAPCESSRISANQMSSFFTKKFVTAQNTTNFEKCVLTFFDHLFVLNVVSMANTSRGQSPKCSKCPPFAGFKFFNSFDEMYLNT